MSTRNGAINYRKPIFEGFSIQMKGPGQERRAREIVTKSLGPDWDIEPFGDERTDFEVSGKEAALSVEEAWGKTYLLRAQPDVVYAEPLFAVSISAPPEEDEASPQMEPDSGPRPDRGDSPAPDRSGGDFVPLPESENLEWIFQQMHVNEAWQNYFPDPNELPGKGIVIGHPDTGYREHPEIIDNLLLDKARDFVADDRNALDELDRGFLLFPGHGTSTASVIISPTQTRPGYEGGNVKGLAPGARLIPIRVSRSVVHISMKNVAKAIEYATDQGAHVISMSLGGLFSHRLRKAIVYAQKRGVIVISAAGNNVRFVVWPAAYEEVIAVAASNARRLPWKGSSRGSAVDVTAPGESVWVARIGERDDDYTVERSSGTSYATAAVAAVAAMWLSYHGRDGLVERYGAEKIPFLFNQILRDTCDPVDWSEDKYGTGIVNAERALAAALPDGVERFVTPPAFGFEDHVPIDNGGIETFKHLFEQSVSEGPPVRGAFGDYLRSDARLRSKLARLLRTTEERLPGRLKEVGQELAFHLAVDPELYSRFEEALSADESDSVERGGGDGNVEGVRGQLLMKGVSDALQAKIAGGR